MLTALHAPCSVAFRLAVSRMLAPPHAQNQLPGATSGSSRSTLGLRMQPRQSAAPMGDWRPAAMIAGVEGILRIDCPDHDPIADPIATWKSPVRLHWSSETSDISPPPA